MRRRKAGPREAGPREAGPREAGPREAEPPVLALTQGDPAGIGPEILLKILAGRAPGDEPPPLRRRCAPLLVAERAAFEALRGVVPEAPWERFRYLGPAPNAAAVAEVLRGSGIPVVDPAGDRPAAAGRAVIPGRPSAADAAGAIAALDRGVELTRRGIADALVTGPVNKGLIARHQLPSFRGHTDYLAAAAGLERYGRDYLMAFLAPDLKVALLTVHLPLADAVAAVRREVVREALRCLHRHLGQSGDAGAADRAEPRIAVAGLNPHAGEGGLLGRQEVEEIAPAVADARREGIDARGPESPDSLFARARRGEVDWVLALYHDQGLIAVKTAAFGRATNWTLGLPYLRTSVDHGTAYDIAGRGVADAGPLREVLRTTLELLAERRRRPAAGPVPPERVVSDSRGRW
jgi:4-hydroxythreonine-4-phosphate dehydrogenase